MNAKFILILGLAATAGVALAAQSRRSIDTTGQGVDWPTDQPGDPAPGDWGGLPPEFGAVLDMIGASVNPSGGGLSPEGLQRLKGEEGFSATPYPDFKGYSIGYGHLIKPGEDLTHVTEEQASELLAADVQWAEECVMAAVTVPLSQNQFDALVLLAYNIGARAFKASTLVRLLNAGDEAGAAAQFDRWNRAGGAVNVTLVARRARERALFEA